MIEGGGDIDRPAHSRRFLTQAMEQALKTKKKAVDHKSKTFRAMTCRWIVNL
jgi:hypothetical protein